MLSNKEIKTLIVADKATFVELVEVITSRLLQQQKSDKQEPWVDKETAMSMMQIGATSLWKLRSTQAIEIAQFGRTILYSRKSIEEYIEKHKIKAI